MTTKRDYYETLGINRNANEEEVRKAFRKKAMEFHPDRNKEPGADAKFKEVNEAYQILSDPNRRAKYDQFGHAGVNSSGGQGFEGFDVFGGFGDIFDDFLEAEPLSALELGQEEHYRQIFPSHLKKPHLE